jgi:hypothetical protein
MLKGYSEVEEEGLALIKSYVSLRSKGGEFDTALAPKTGEGPQAIALRHTANNVASLAKAARRTLARAEAGADGALTPDTKDNLTMIAEELEQAEVELNEITTPEAIFSQLDTNRKHEITSQMTYRNVERVALIHARIKGDIRKQKNAAVSTPPATTPPATTPPGKNK